jgi:bile acid:Na+ symporter, BASS family
LLQQINRRLEKLMPFITPASIVLGIIFSTYLKDLTFLVPWLFACMTFEGSLGMNFKSIKNALAHPFPVFIALGILHILMPLWAWAVGHVAFSGDAYTITGLVLGMVIPTGVTSFIWVSIYKGHSALTLAIILIDSLLSPFIVPYSLSLFVGQKVEMDVAGMMSGLLFMIVLPSIAGMILNEITKGKVKDVWKPRLSPISKVFLGTVVMLNGAVIAPYFKHIDLRLIFVILVVLFISITGYVFSFFISKLLKCEREMVVTLTYTSGMRNISAGSVIAMSYFPSAVVVVVVVGMLFQQTLASLFGTFLDKHYSKKVEEPRRMSV